MAEIMAERVGSRQSSVDRGIQEEVAASWQLTVVSKTLKKNLAGIRAADRGKRGDSVLAVADAADEALNHSGYFFGFLYPKVGFCLL